MNRLGFVVAALSFFLLNSCGDKEDDAKDKTASCDIVISSATLSLHTCFEYTNLTEDEATNLSSKCASAEIGGQAGTGATAACTTEDELGRCAVTGTSGSPNFSVVFYPDYSATTAEASCEGSFTGTWTAAASE